MHNDSIRHITCATCNLFRRNAPVCNNSQVRSQANSAKISAPMSKQHHFFDLTDTELAEAVQAIGMPKFRAKQLFDWVYQKGVIDPDQMTNLSAKDRQNVRDHFIFLRGKAIRHQVATDGTQKLLIDWALSNTDLNVVNNAGGSESQTECVMIPAQSEAGVNRKTACISSQVGFEGEGPLRCGVHRYNVRLGRDRLTGRKVFFVRASRRGRRARFCCGF